MMQAPKKLLEEFDTLQEEQAEVLAELLRRVAGTPHDLPDAEDLVAVADQVFVELDRREQPR
jgi:DNA-directed RNA polymerase specialized sigma24 family protein